MAIKKGKQTILFEIPKTVSYWASVGCKKESEGPLGKNFDFINPDSTFGEKSWEKGESIMIEKTVSVLLEKSQKKPEDIDLLFAGDLINQCTSTTYALRDFGIPIYGAYGACSTMAETTQLACLALETKAIERAIALTSSHFCTAERQFRYPLEYGSVKTPTAQWTVTGSGALMLENGGNPPYVRGISTGIITDMGIKDQSNMGAAMAPAAAETIIGFFKDTNMKPTDFDLIATGDLGVVGSKLLLDLTDSVGLDIKNQHTDCGNLIYDLKRQNAPAGASGCGCSASVLTTAFLKPLSQGSLKNILFIATGALMSPLTIMQKETIPSIAHLVWFSNEKGGTQ